MINNPELPEEIKDLAKFIDASYTPWHAVENLKLVLDENDFIELNEKDKWKLEFNKSYYTIRDGSSLIAFKVPQNIDVDESSSIWFGAHTDSPSLKIKANYQNSIEGYDTLGVEVYGGPMLNSWFDRDLKIAGRLVYEKDGLLYSKNYNSDFTVRIPQLAIHLDRTVNSDGFKTNPQTQIVPIIGLEGGIRTLDSELQNTLSDDEVLKDFDLFLCDSQATVSSGINHEFIAGARLDDLSMVHAGYKSLLDSSNSKNIIGCAFFNHEEIGSSTFSGADSNYFNSILERIYTGLGVSRDDYLRNLSQSLMVSADAVHAVHPAYPERYEDKHKPIINQGPTVKRSALMRYGTDALTAAQFKACCQAVGVTVQEFVPRNDIGAGSTIGPIMASNAGIRTIDVGNPMLSMHSIREIIGVKDHLDMIAVMGFLFRQVENKTSASFCSVKSKKTL